MSKVVIFPTDTVYGIGCKIFDIEAIERIYEIKKRSYDKPLACLCTDVSQMEEIAEITPLARTLIEKFMPGGLTLILKTKPQVFEKIGYKTIGVRIPKHTLAIELLKENGPMLTTSANESGKKELNNIEEIYRFFKNQVDEIYPPNQESSHIASTVIDCTQEKMKLLREGELTFYKIKEALNV